jgi:autonomous glycyl radical cofactor
MITGIQITKAANDDLMNSFWLLDSEKGEARCVVAKAGFAEDEIVPVSKLGEIEYREIPGRSAGAYVHRQRHHAVDQRSVAV